MIHPHPHPLRGRETRVFVQKLNSKEPTGLQHRAANLHAIFMFSPAVNIRSA